MRIWIICGIVLLLFSACSIFKPRRGTLHLVKVEERDELVIERKKELEISPVKLTDAKEERSVAAIVNNEIPVLAVRPFLC